MRKPRVIASERRLDQERRMVRPEGLEPPAYWFEASRSIQLSYGRTVHECSAGGPVAQNA